MLKISLQSGQRVEIGDDITIKVVEIQNNRLELGIINAPKWVAIHRKEADLTYNEDKQTNE